MSRQHSMMDKSDSGGFERGSKLHSSMPNAGKGTRYKVIPKRREIRYEHDCGQAKLSACIIKKAADKLPKLQKDIWRKEKKEISKQFGDRQNSYTTSVGEIMRELNVLREIFPEDKESELQEQQATDSEKECPNCFHLRVDKTNLKLQAQVDTLQHELETAKAELQTAKKARNKLQAERKRVSDVVDSAQSDKQNAERNLDIALKSRDKLEKEMAALAKERDEMLQNYVPRGRIRQLEEEVQHERKSKEDALTRLSALASSKLPDNDPNITDLSDENRPTKVGEQMCELYDNQWTEAFDELCARNMDDLAAIQALLAVLVETYKASERQSLEDTARLQEIIGTDGNGAGQVLKSVKDIRKKNTYLYIARFNKSRAVDLRPIVGGALETEAMTAYVEKCTELCWLMLVQDPPLCLQEATPTNGELDTKVYKEYSQRGPYLQYLVWPPLLLYKGGPMLAKGVAQGGKQRVALTASSKLRDNDPNITDLSDENRPTKVGEQMCELYDNQWTEAFDELCARNMDDLAAIQALLAVLVETYKASERQSLEDMARLQEIIGTDRNGAGQVLKSVKDIRKKNTYLYIARFNKSRAVDLRPIVGGALETEAMTAYVEKCTELCWLMLVQDPPLCLQEATPTHGELDTKVYKEYTQRGPYLQYLVWPPLLLHKGGPMLAKGVAQGGKQRVALTGSRCMYGQRSAGEMSRKSSNRYNSAIGQISTLSPYFEGSPLPLDHALYTDNTAVRWHV